MGVLVVFPKVHDGGEIGGWGFGGGRGIGGREVRSDGAGFGIFGGEGGRADGSRDICYCGADGICDDVGGSVDVGDGWGDGNGDLSAADSERSQVIEGVKVDGPNTGTSSHLSMGDGTTQQSIWTSQGREGDLPDRLLLGGGTQCERAASIGGPIWSEESGRDTPRT